MLSFPFLDLLLVSVSLRPVALLTQRLQVRAVVELVDATDRPRLDVIHTGGRPGNPVAPALLAQRMLGPECPAELDPPPGVVDRCGAFADILSFCPGSRLLRVPCEFHR